MARTIFMIHGMWGGPWCWEKFQAYFENQGYQCVVPTLRHHDVPPHGSPPPGLGATSLLDYAADLEAQIRSLPEEPIIMGHSMGGFLAQKLAARGLGKAAVFITPAAPRGIFATRWSVLKSFRGALFTWGFWEKANMPSLDEAVYSMMALLSPEEQRQAHDRFVFESGRAAAELGFWLLDCGRASEVDEAGICCPVLVVAGGQDRITPATVVRQVARKYARVATYKEFPDHAHWILGERGWEDVAAYVQRWLGCFALT